MGAFKNREFGTYTRYSYTDCEFCAVLKIDDISLVINGSDEESTVAIYKEILTRVAE